MTEDNDRTDEDLVHVTVAFTKGDGTTVTSKRPVEKALRPMLHSIKATARTIWREAGSPKNAHVEVEVRRTVAEFAVEDGELRKIDR